MIPLHQGHSQGLNSFPQVSAVGSTLLMHKAVPWSECVWHSPSLAFLQVQVCFSAVQGSKTDHTSFRSAHRPACLLEAMQESETLLKLLYCVVSVSYYRLIHDKCLKVLFIYCLQNSCFISALAHKIRLLVLVLLSRQAQVNESLHLYFDVV